MKYILLLFTVLLISCGSTNKAYICGDHKCENKKEAREYFEKNLNVEVEIKKKNNKENFIDLAELNTEVFLDEKEEKLRLVNMKNINKQKSVEKDKLDKETDIFYSEEELKSIEEKIISKEVNEEKLNKIAKNNENQLNKNTRSNQDEIKKLNKENRKKSIKVSDMDSSNDFCRTANDCDIEKISKHIKTVGKTKKYPNLSIK